MKERYYYLRKTKEMGGGSYGQHRCGIVYLISDGDKLARGVSLCNDCDPFTRDAGFLPNEDNTFSKFVGGLELAKKRAIKAFMSGESSDRIALDDAKAKVPDWIGCKSEYSPFLSDYEKEILSDKEG